MGLNFKDENFREEDKMTIIEGTERGIGHLVSLITV